MAKRTPKPVASGRTILMCLEELKNIQNEFNELTAQRHNLIETIQRIDARRRELVGYTASGPDQYPDPVTDYANTVLLPFDAAAAASMAKPKAVAKSAAKSSGTHGKKIAYNPPAKNPMPLKDRLLQEFKRRPGMSIHVNELAGSLQATGWKSNAKKFEDVIRMCLRGDPAMFSDKGKGFFAYSGQ